ncbi:MAG: amino acid adenylation domain-containing protein [Leptolyngbyaceae cyanobacterium SM1_3_5]|nr:amino acid adenylation domain-containing protein [Leptolyngbyaceae cyanobacterium SM1_3_5]
MQETDQGLIGFVEYNTDLFKRETIDRLMKHYQHLLQTIVANPEQRLSELSILTAAEQSQLAEWNDTLTEYPQDLCIHQLFETQIEQTPDAIALVWNQHPLTYEQLNCQANQLAHFLQQKVTSEARIGICLNKSLDLIVAVLAVLKAGGAYLPLDPNYPPDRLSFMLKDAGISALITHSSLLEIFSDQKIESICLDRDWEAIALERQTNLTVKNPAHLAYVIYTSGSTGTAKGVMVSHRSLVNAYFAWKDAYQLEMFSSHLQMASFSFDVFTGDWVRALCSGAKLVLCPYEFLLEAESLYSLMRQQQINTAEFSPAVLRNLMQYLQNSQRQLDFMKLLIVGSDSFYVQEYQELQHLCSPETRLLNSYGVSEATIDSSYFEMACLTYEQQNDCSNHLIPIGRPFANTQIYLLDVNLQPVPIGVVGELHIGGAGLAQGYLNRPELTQQRFIHHLGQRLYKTGDLACYRSDGTIELLGRSDYQVKLRGFRIELEEIGALLMQHSTVREAIATIHEDGDKRLIAYVVLRQKLDDAEASLVAALRSFLKTKLPQYILPASFVMLDAMPLTPNGKIDRKALPAPEKIHIDEANFVLPSTAIEQTLADIWTEILQLPRVGISDNFFDLGGHSLLATSLVFRICKAFLIEFPLRHLFEAPTIAAQSKLIEQIQSTQTNSVPTLPLLKRSSKAPIPLSLSQQYIWHLQQLNQWGTILTVLFW